jgi:hypothetical protein
VHFVDDVLLLLPALELARLRQHLCLKGGILFFDLPQFAQLALFLILNHHIQGTFGKHGVHKGRTSVRIGHTLGAPGVHIGAHEAHIGCTRGAHRCTWGAHWVHLGRTLGAHGANIGRTMVHTGHTCIAFMVVVDRIESCSCKRPFSLLIRSSLLIIFCLSAMIFA